MTIRQGDRVRILAADSEYTGCRGTVVDPDEPGVAALGRLVAIDGENGVARPFLVGALEVLRAARVASAARAEKRTELRLRSDVEGD